MNRGFGENMGDGGLDLGEWLHLEGSYGGPSLLILALAGLAGEWPCTFKYNIPAALPVAERQRHAWERRRRGMTTDKGRVKGGRTGPVVTRSLRVGVDCSDLMFKSHFSNVRETACRRSPLRSDCEIRTLLKSK